MSIRLFHKNIETILYTIFLTNFCKHNYNIMIETKLTRKKTVYNLFGVNPFVPNLTTTS